MLSYSQVRELFLYNPQTGDLTWNDSSLKSSNIAGTLDSDGYLVTRIGLKVYKNHRIIWLWYYGYLPENLIDHKDRVKHHNWIDNLREISNSCNAKNTGNRVNNKSGVKGVSFYKKYNKWHVQISIKDKRKNLGYFEDFVDAVAHRLACEQCTDCGDISPSYLFVKDYVSSILNG